MSSKIRFMDKQRLIHFCFLLILLIAVVLFQTSEERFVRKYEFEDFSRFRNCCIYIRSSSFSEMVIMLSAPDLIYDSIYKKNLYTVTVNKKNHTIKEIKWMPNRHFNVNADTSSLNLLLRTFVSYDIPRLDVDSVGNVFVYLKNVEKIALVKTENVESILNTRTLAFRYRKVKYKKIKKYWYAVKY